MNVIEIIDKAIKEGKSRFAFELLPPLKGAGMEGLFEAIDPLMEFDPAYINVTFHRESIKNTTLPNGAIESHVVRRRPGTVGISAAIQKKYGVPVVPHLICGGLSRYDIEDALIDMDFLGLRNVLALRGDKPNSEDKFTPHPQGHAYAVDLVNQISGMNRGEFIDGEVEVCHHSRFSIGVAGYPEMHSDSPSEDIEMEYLKEKIKAGAQYIITQLFFDNSKFLNFVERCRKAGIEVPIIPGIKPLATVKHLTILPRIFNVEIPEILTKEVVAHPHRVKEIGIEWAIAQGEELKRERVPILHFYTMGKAESTRRIVRSLF